MTKHIVCEEGTQEREGNCVENLGAVNVKIRLSGVGEETISTKFHAIPTIKSLERLLASFTMKYHKAI